MIPLAIVVVVVAVAIRYRYGKRARTVRSARDQFQGTHRHAPAVFPRYPDPGRYQKGGWRR